MSKYMCQLCANHGQFYQPKKGHKQKCPYRNCPCDLCELNIKRRALDQIERRLRTESDKTMTNFESQTKSNEDENLQSSGKGNLSMTEECSNENDNNFDNSFLTEYFEKPNVAQKNMTKPDFDFYSHPKRKHSSESNKNISTVFDNHVEATQFPAQYGKTPFHSIDRLLSVD